MHNNESFHRQLEDPVKEFWRHYQGWTIMPSEKEVREIRIPKRFGMERISLFKKILPENGYEILKEREDDKHIFISYTKKK